MSEEKKEKAQSAPAKPRSIKRKTVSADEHESQTRSSVESGTATAVGRRKAAIARVRLTQGSSGAIAVNGKEYKIYFPIALLQRDIERPLVAANVLGSIEVTAKVTGGGFRGQAEALRLGIARGLLALDPSIKKTLRSQGLVTRDSRVKERKKPGLKRARRAPQFSKR